MGRLTTTERVHGWRLRRTDVADVRDTGRASSRRDGSASGGYPRVEHRFILDVPGSAAAGLDRIAQCFADLEFDVRDDVGGLGLLSGSFAAFYLRGGLYVPPEELPIQGSVQTLERLRSASCHSVALQDDTRTSWLGGALRHRYRVVFAEIEMQIRHRLA